MSIATFLYFYGLFLVFFILVWSGYIVNVWYAFKVCIGAFLDVVCQAWIDICRIFSKPIRLDEFEDKMSK